MTPKEITNEDLYNKLEEIRKLMSAQLAAYKLVNAKTIEDLQTKILELKIRKDIFDACDGKKTVNDITKLIFPNEPLNKAQPKISYHLGILEDYWLVDYRDDKGQRYYYKKKG
jgi:DNA-binding transcriptional ArsR family regulator